MEEVPPLVAERKAANTPTLILCVG